MKPSLSAEARQAGYKQDIPWLRILSNLGQVAFIGLAKSGSQVKWLGFDSVRNHSWMNLCWFSRILEYFLLLYSISFSACEELGWI